MVSNLNVNIFLGCVVEYLVLRKWLNEGALIFGVAASIELKLVRRINSQMLIETPDL